MLATSFYSKSNHLIISFSFAGLSVETIAEKYNIGSSTVSEICKRRAQIVNAVEKSKISGQGKTKKTLRESTKPLVEGELHSWYLDQMDQEVLPSAADLIQKAKEINLQIGSEEEDWNPST